MRRPKPGCAVLSYISKLHCFGNLVLTIVALWGLRLLALNFRSRCALAAENLVLRKQLALDVERQ